jgi:hypothetical protein
MPVTALLDSFTPRSSLRHMFASKKSICKLNRICPNESSVCVLEIGIRLDGYLPLMSRLIVGGSLSAFYERAPWYQGGWCRFNHAAHFYYI